MCNEKAALKRMAWETQVRLLWRHFRGTSLSFGPQFTLHVNINGFFYHLHPEVQLTSL